MVNYLTHRVLEFKLNDRTVTDKLEEWLPSLRRLWNIGLARLEEYEKNKGSYIPQKLRTSKYQQTAPKCNLPYEWKNYPIDKHGGIIAYGDKKIKRESWISVPYSSILNDPHEDIFQAKDAVKVVVPSTGKGKGKTAQEWLDSDNKVVVTKADLVSHWGWYHSDSSFYSCPLPQNYLCPVIKRFHLNECQVFNPSFTGLQGLSTVGTVQFLKDRFEGDLLTAVPSAYRNGVLKDLGRAWEQYQKQPKRGKPKYRRHNELPDSVADQAPNKKAVKLDGDSLCGVAYFKKIHIPNISKRWRCHNGSIPVVTVIRFVKKRGNWYIQLTGEFDIEKTIKQDRVGAVDPGVFRYLTFDDGKTVVNPYKWRKYEEKIKVIQQKISHKRDQQLLLFLCHPSTTAEDIISIIRISKDNANQLLGVKTEQGVIDIIGGRYTQILKRRITGVFPDRLGNGKTIKRLEQQLTVLHNRLKDNRRGFAHRVSTWVAKHYKVFVCEDGLQDEGVKHRSKLKMNDDGQALPNKQSAKAGLTKSLSDMALGQFMTLTQTKMLQVGGTFIRFDKGGRHCVIYSPDNPKGLKIDLGKHPTTKSCVICGHINNVPSNVAQGDPLFYCENCGHHDLGRDQKAAVLMLVILAEKDIININDCSPITQKTYEQRKDYRVTTNKRRIKGSKEQLRLF